MCIRDSVNTEAYQNEVAAYEEKQAKKKNKKTGNATLAEEPAADSTSDELATEIKEPESDTDSAEDTADSNDTTTGEDNTDE